MEGKFAQPGPEAAAILWLPPHATRFPVRALRTGQTLIGSGSECSLRLGDGSVPLQHSILRVSDSGARIETLCDQYSVLINGTAVRRADLRDGDLLEFGATRMVFRTLQPGLEASGPSSGMQDLQQLISSAEPAGGTLPTDLSAEELVDALEHELSLIAQFDRSELTGVAELLQTAAEMSDTQGSRADSGSEPPPTDPSTVLRQIQELLDSQQRRLSAIEGIVEQVVRQQQMTADTLHAMTERLAELSNAASAACEPARRASA